MDGACDRVPGGPTQVMAQTNPEDIRINFERLQRELMELAEIGQEEGRGLYRMAFTEADMKARAWLRRLMDDAGIASSMDGAANVWGRLGGGEGPAVIIGSHLDCVPNGGKLDGTLGVMVGLECLRRIKEEKIPTRRPVEMVSFSDEEGRFGGLFGSQAVAGELNPELISQAKDLRGVSLTEAMQAHGLDAMAALNARRDPATVGALLEVHIEQGPVLDEAGLSVGIVEDITGLFKWSVRLTGAANHAGTTPMTMRRDPLMGLAEFAGEIPRILEEHGSGASRATIGKVDLLPGVANTIPGEVVFSLDVRDIDAEKLEELHDGFRRVLSTLARRRSLMFEFEILSRVEPVPCAASIVATIEATSQRLGLPARRMPSGAAHDAQIMAKIAPIGMIFVPSRDGRSHSPAEWTAWKDIENGANAALQTLIALANQEDPLTST